MTTNFFKLCNNYLSFCLLVSLSIKSKSESCLAVSDTLRSHEFIQSIKFSRPEHWGGKLFPSPEDLPNPGIEPRSPTLQAESLPAELQGKPKNTGVGSLCLLQGIFLNQESNGGLRHCRLILYQLSYQGSPCSSRLSRNNLRKRKKSRKIKI